ncbi:MAG: sulfite exporter TauE/SafE family protein [Planctomycetes bacterium]|nr:sulfite exporter TauE/SafE family protein [Planctomycetota bacterium]
MTPLVLTAAFVAFSHTAIGIDHSLPFIALSRARGWSRGRTLAVTAVCGLAHVASSILIGFGAWWLGSELGATEALESRRGDLAAWLMLAFGIAYGAWGVWRQRGHGHSHRHGLGHHHGDPGQVARSATFWTIFIIFALGPCEPLIPILLYPALKADLATAIVVVSVFAVVTLATMLALVFLGLKGLDLLPTRAFERHAHALAGLAIAVGAAGILFLGL